jgi:hypothetical protein
MFEFSDTYWMLGGGLLTTRPVYLAKQAGPQGQAELTMHSERAERFSSLAAAQQRCRVLRQGNGSKGVDGGTLRPLQVTVTTCVFEAEDVV